MRFSAPCKAAMGAHRDTNFEGVNAVEVLPKVAGKIASGAAGFDKGKACHPQQRPPHGVTAILSHPADLTRLTPALCLTPRSDDDN